MSYSSETLRDYVKLLKENGFKVFVSPNRDNRPITYIHFEKDGQIGYCEASRFGGLQFSTTHKPNARTGTGYRITEEKVYEPTTKHAEATFINMPSWAKDDLKDVVKYKDFEDYKKTTPNTILSYEEVII